MRKLVFAMFAAAAVLSGCGRDFYSVLSTELDDAAISAFSITAGGTACSGFIDSSKRAVSVVMPHGTDRSSLVAEFTATADIVAVGANVQTSGSSVNNFTNPVTYHLSGKEVMPADYVVTAVNTPVLSSLVMSGTGITGFDSGTTSYSIAVDNAVASVTFTPSSDDAGALISVDGETVASGNSSSAIPLASGETRKIAVIVTIDGTSAATSYSVAVTRNRSSNSQLSSLAVSSGSLDPVFDAGVTSYSVSVGYPVSAIDVTASAEDPAAKISCYVNDVKASSGSGIALAEGAVTKAAVAVTAEDGSVNTYVISVTRASRPSTVCTLASLSISAGSLTFDSDSTYTGNVPVGTASFTLTPVATDPNATIKIGSETVSSGGLSSSISVDKGATAAVYVVVTAEDGITAKTYSVSVSRPPYSTSLSSLVSTGGLSPAFSASTNAYTVSLDNTVTHASVTPTAEDPDATIKVDGASVTSGSSSALYPLTPGTPYTMTIVVTSGSASSSYTVTFTRAKSSNCYLSAIGISPMSVPSFDRSVMSYDMDAAYETDAVTVTPTAEDSTASITVDGASVSSGSGKSVPLTAGAAATITVVVTAADGSNRTYYFKITRAAGSSNASLGSIALSSGASLSPVFSPNVTVYKSEVSSSVSSITVTPTGAYSPSLIRVNGETVSNGTVSSGIALVSGRNTVTVDVVAQDGVTSRRYTITVNKLAEESITPYLSSLSLSTGVLSPLFRGKVASYTAEVASNISALTVTPVAAGSGSSIQVNGGTVASGDASNLIGLPEGITVISVTVTAANGTTFSYTIAVTRPAAGTYSSNALLAGLETDTGELSPSFSSAAFDYTLNIAGTNCRLTPYLAGPGATMTINGDDCGSGTQSAPLYAGTDAAIKIVADDGTIQTYTVHIIADTTPPAAGSLSAEPDIGFAALSWTEAADTVTPTAGLRYAVYRLSAAASSVAGIESAGTLLLPYTSGVTSFSAGGLSPDTSYIFAVIVQDGAGNKTAYPTASVTTLPVLGATGFNGTVKALCQYGSTLYAGGYFSAAGTAALRAALLSKASGIVMTGFSLAVNGKVADAVSDGEGGWFIAGNFTRVNGAMRTNLAHVLSDGSVDGWNPSPDGIVSALALRGSDLYAGGAFTTMCGVSRTYAAGVDAENGAVLSWAPSVNGAVQTMAVSGSSLYAGGSFTIIGGSTRNHIAAFNLNTGVLNPAWNPGANDVVCALAVSGGMVYAGGAFTVLGGASRGYIGALSENGSGSVESSWNPAASSAVYSIALYGGKVYVGGAFTSIGGASYMHLAELNAADGSNTGSAVAWDSRVNNTVYDLAVSGGTLYAGGDFTAVSVTPVARYRLAAYSLGTTPSLITSWDGAASSSVRAVAAAGNAVFAGGDFTVVNMKPRAGIAALDVSSGTLTTFNPSPNGTVNAIAVSSDGASVYFGGSFSSVNGTARSNLGAVDSNGNIFTGWNPDPNGAVNALCLTASSLLVGGDFSSVTDNSTSTITAVEGLVALNPSTGYPLFSSFNADLAGDGVNNVTALLPYGSDCVLAAGDFQYVRGAYHPHLVALNVDSGAPAEDSWNPTPGNSVYALAFDANAVYVGGSFYGEHCLGDHDRSYLGAVELPPTTVQFGDETSWEPKAGGTVRALQVHDGRVYAGGDFQTINSEPRSRLVSLTPSDAYGAVPVSALSIDHDFPEANGSVHVLRFSDDGSSLFVGGEFSEIGGKLRASFAVIDPVTKKVK